MNFRNLEKTCTSTILEDSKFENSMGNDLSRRRKEPDDILKKMKKSLENELIKECQKGNRKATERLIDSLDGYLWERVRKEMFTDEMRAEGFNCAIVGLLKAIQTFNVEKGYSLITYARAFIDKEILILLRFELSIKKKRFTRTRNYKTIEITSFSLNDEFFEIDEESNSALQVIDVELQRVEDKILCSDHQMGILQGLNNSESTIVERIMNGETIGQISKTDGSMDWKKYRKVRHLLNKLRMEVI